jgi:phosphatidate phosphatase APP1
MKYYLTFITLITLGFSNAYAEDLRLSCNVSGETNKHYNDGGLDDKRVIVNQKIDVLVMDDKSKLVIKVDSLDKELSQVVTNVPVKNDKGRFSEVINKTDKNQFFLINLDSSEGIKYNEQVRIDRVTGKIFVKSVSDGGKKNMSVRIDYSGDCEAFKNTNKF